LKNGSITLTNAWVLAITIVVVIVSSTALAGATSGSVWDHVPPRNHVRPNPLANRPDSVSAGAILYRDHCQSCHRPDAQGDGNKRPALRSEHIRTASDGDIEWFLRQGDLRHGMPSWFGLPEAQRWQIVSYLKSLQ
jgi:mono/diheme cytochrome c family protein